MTSNKGQAPTVLIGDNHYDVRQATAAHLQALAPLVGVFTRLDEMGVETLLAHSDELCRAVAVVTGCPRHYIDDQPVHELVRIVEETAAGWMVVNGPYLEQQVAPAIHELTERVKAMAAQAKANQA